MELPRGYISYNQIRLYQNCPRLYYLKYIEGIETALDDKIFLGIVFHASVEGHLKKRINGQFCSARETLDTFSRLFNEEQARWQVDWRSNKGDVKLRGEALLTLFLKEIDNDIDPLMVEEEMEAEIPQITVRLRGVIDLVEKDFSISDFKTSTARWSRERAEGSFLQMAIYRYLFEQRFGPVTKNLKFRIFYSRSTRTARHQVISYPANQADFQQMVGIISRVVDGIRSEAFCPNPSYRCAHCEFKLSCSGMKSGSSKA